MLQTPITFWLVSVSFMLFQFFLQLSSGIVLNCLSKDIALSAYEAGFIASAFYYVYTVLQIPVGMLFDKKNSRTLLIFSSIVCSLGCILFAYSDSLLSLSIARFIMGSGSAFAFVGVTHILREHFEPKKLGFMLGLSQTLAFFVTVIFIFFMGVLSTEILWRKLMLYSGFCGLFITLLCILLLPNKPPIPSINHPSIWKSLKALSCNKIAWFNGVYVGAGFAIITVFGAMWAVPFIQIKTGCDIHMASIIDACLFLGAGFGCPFYNKIELLIKSRKTMLFWAYFITALLFLITLFIQNNSLLLMGTLMLAMGVISGSYIVSFTIANEISPPKAESTSSGFTNMFAVISAPIFQPLEGFFLDSFKHEEQYHLIDYQYSLLLIPILLFIAAFIGLLLPEALDKK